MSGDARDRLLFVAADFTYGGTALLLVRHLRRLLEFYDIDLVITGPVDARMLREVPTAATVHRHHPWRPRLPARLRLTEDPLASFLLLPARAPFRRPYRAALMAAGIIDWRACMLLAQARVPRKLLFVTDNSLYPHDYYGARARAAIDCMIQAADRVLPVSRGLWQELTAARPLLAQRPWEVMRPPLEALVVDPSIVPAPSPYGEAATPIVLTVARLFPEKGLERSIRLHERLKREGRQFRWFVVGAGPTEELLRAEIAQRGLVDDFMLVGRQPDLGPWLAHCDLFAFFSEREGCPTVVMEALRARRPVIATAVHGVDEIIDNGRTGLIVAQDDEAIAAGLSHLLEDAALRDALHRNLSMDASGATASDDTARLRELIDAPVAPVAPQVSILIPTFNQQAWIERAIASALMQDFARLEVVVVDDASTDETAVRVAAWLDDPRLRYVRNPQNLGRVANYRHALGDLARGDWVLMLDGDDYLIDASFIRGAMDAIARHEPGRVVFAQAGHRIQIDGADAPTVPDLLPRIDGAVQLIPGAEYLRLVYDTGFFTHLGTLYDRQAALRCGFYSADISSSDMDSLLRLALQGDVLLLNTVAGCWVHHGANASTQLPLARIPENVRIFRRIATDAVARGLITAPAIAGPLSRYEALTLAHLCAKSLEGKPPRLPLLLRMLAVIFAVNPGLIFQPAVARVCYEFVCRMTGIAPRNRLARWLRKRWRRRNREGRA